MPPDDKPKNKNSFTPAYHRLTTRYRLQLRLPGSDDFTSVKTVRSLETTLTGLPPGTEIEARLIAANSRGETSPSPVVRVKVA